MLLEASDALFQIDLGVVLKDIGTENFARKLFVPPFGELEKPGEVAFDRGIRSFEYGVDRSFLPGSRG